MTEKFFKRDDVPFMVDPDAYSIFMFIGDSWVQINSPEVRTAIRLKGMEISRSEAMALALGHGNRPLYRTGNGSSFINRPELHGPDWRAI